MEYRVKITNYAVDQLQEINRYISKSLQAPEVAAKWMQRMKREMADLNIMPKRYPLTEEDPWHTKGIHKMTVDNFIVYYWVDDNKSIVWITGVIYGRRDQLMALGNMPIVEE